jgi:hypothetical protein
LREIVDELSGFVRTLDPGELIASDAADLLSCFARAANLAGTGRLLVAPRAAEAGTWRAKGYRSAQEWMAAQAGTSTGAAAEDLATGRRLGDCPAAERAAREGDLSREQASAITDAASADPSADRDLVERAKAGTDLKSLREEAKARKAAADPDPDATHRRIHRARRVRTWTDREGAWCASLRGTVADGARVEARLRSATDDVFARARKNGQREPAEAYAFDALVGLITGLVPHPPAAGGTTAPAPGASTRPASDRPSRTRSTGTDTAGTAAQAPATTGATGTGTGAGRATTDTGTTDTGSAGAGTGGSGTADTASGTGTTGVATATGSAATAGTAAQSTGTATGTATGPNTSITAPGAGVPDPATGTGAGAGSQGDLADTAGWRLPAPASRSGADAKIIVLIDHQALCRGHTLAGETSHIAGIGPVPVSVVRDWMSDAFLAAVVRDGTEITAVTHLGRRPTARQRTALQARGIRCTRTGCGRTDGLELDHRIDWHKTRHTRVDELDWLCSFDHALKTLYRWALVPGVGQRDLVPPDDPRHPDQHPTGSSATSPTTGRPTSTDSPPGGSDHTSGPPTQPSGPRSGPTRSDPSDRSPPDEARNGDQLTFAS